MIILICREYMNLDSIWDMWCECGKSETVQVYGCVFLFAYVCALAWDRARTQRELESSDSTMPLPTQTWAWLLLWSIKSETGRQSASWLRPSLTHSPLVLNAYSCHTLMNSCLPLCLLHIKIFLPHTQAICEGRGICNLTWLVPEYSLVLPEGNKV